MPSSNAKSWLTHAVVAVLWTLAIAWATGNALAGALSAALFFLAREVTQAQYHIKERTGMSLKDQPLWFGFDVTEWTADARVDVVAAVVGAGAAFALWRFL